jgi:anti-sigma regulatory factor (Ser/Thr protein kinase)
VRQDGNQHAMRTDVRAFLSRAGVFGQRADDVVLVLTELVTNGIDAAQGAAPVSSVLSVEPAMIIVEVTNPRRAHASALAIQQRLTMPSEDAERGRGLPLVSMLSARMSTETTPFVTVVRAEILR